jgi:hypothetical protein
MIAARRPFGLWRAGTGDEGQFQAPGINKHLKPLLGTLAQLGFRFAPGVACLRGIEADQSDVLAQSRESDCISVNDADIS